MLVVRVRVCSPREHSAAWAELVADGAVALEGGPLALAQAINSSLYSLRSALVRVWEWVTRTCVVVLVCCCKAHIT